MILKEFHYEKLTEKWRLLILYIWFFCFWYFHKSLVFNRIFLSQFMNRSIETRLAPLPHLHSNHIASQHLRPRRHQINLMEIRWPRLATSRPDIVTRVRTDLNRDRTRDRQWAAKTHTANLKNFHTLLAVLIMGAGKTHDEKQNHRRLHCPSCPTWQLTDNFVVGKHMKMWQAGWAVY